MLFFPMSTLRTVTKIYQYFLDSSSYYTMPTLCSTLDLRFTFKYYIHSFYRKIEANTIPWIKNKTQTIA